MVMKFKTLESKVVQFHRWIDGWIDRPNDTGPRLPKETKAINKEEFLAARDLYRARSAYKESFLANSYKDRALHEEVDAKVNDEGLGWKYECVQDVLKGVLKLPLLPSERRPQHPRPCEYHHRHRNAPHNSPSIRVTRHHHYHHQYNPHHYHHHYHHHHHHHHHPQYDRQHRQYRPYRQQRPQQGSLTAGQASRPALSEQDAGQRQVSIPALPEQDRMPALPEQQHEDADQRQVPLEALSDQATAPALPGQDTGHRQDSTPAFLPPDENLSMCLPHQAFSGDTVPSPLEGKTKDFVDTNSSTDEGDNNKSRRWAISKIVPHSMQKDDDPPVQGLRAVCVCVPLKEPGNRGGTIHKWQWQKKW